MKWQNVWSVYAHVSIRKTYMYDICPPLSSLALPMLSSMIAQRGNGSTTNQPAILNYPVWSCMNLNVNSLALMPLSSKSFRIADSITGCKPQAMLLPSLSSTVMLVTWRSSHQTKKVCKFGKLDRQVIRFLCNFHMKCDDSWQFELAISFYSVIQLCLPHRLPLPTGGWSFRPSWMQKVEETGHHGITCRCRLEKCARLEPYPLKGLRKKGSRIPLNLAAGILGSSQLMLVSFFNQVIYTSASNALPKTRISLSNTNFILLATWVLDMLDNPNCHDAELWDSSSPDAGARAAMQAVDISSNWTYHRSARKP